MNSNEYTDTDGDALTITTRGNDVWITCTTDQSEVTIGPISRATLHAAFAADIMDGGITAALIEHEAEPVDAWPLARARDHTSRASATASARSVRQWAARQYPSGTPLDQDRRMVAAETEAYLSGRTDREASELAQAARTAGPCDSTTGAES